MALNINSDKDSGGEQEEELEMDIKDDADIVSFNRWLNGRNSYMYPNI